MKGEKDMKNDEFRKNKLRYEISDVAKGLVYLIDPPYNKNTIWDNTGRLNQEWKKHFYFIMTDPNFQGYVQVMQMTSQNHGELPISLPIKMGQGEKYGYIRCDSVWAVHSTYFKNSYFRGAYRVRKGEYLPELDDFVDLCFDFYKLINQIVDANSDEGMDILRRVREYEENYRRTHDNIQPMSPIILKYGNWTNPVIQDDTGLKLFEEEGGDLNKTEDVSAVEEADNSQSERSKPSDNTAETENRETETGGCDRGETDDAPMTDGGQSIAVFCEFIR